MRTFDAYAVCFRRRADNSRLHGPAHLKILRYILPHLMGSFVLGGFSFYRASCCQAVSHLDGNLESARCYSQHVEVLGKLRFLFREFPAREYSR